MKVMFAVLVILFLSCATSIQYVKNENNVKYFQKVSMHFNNLGITLDENELHTYTSSIFIGTIPNECEVYCDSILIGNTNLGNIYLKPGTYTLTFKKWHQEAIRKLQLVEGDNEPIFYTFHNIKRPKL